jgi:hypothetical protein
MASRIFSRVEAVRLVGKRGVSVAQAARIPTSARTCCAAPLGEGLTADPAQAFPRHGWSAGDRAVARKLGKLRAERDILKKAAARGRRMATPRRQSK